MSRELPIHNGRMTTDLDANGFKIKNLPPGSGFTQAQADWNQADATAPDFIKNKPAIPAPVSVDATLATQGAAADAKAVGDALRGGFTEWVCNEIGPGRNFGGCEWSENGYNGLGAGWYALVSTGYGMPSVHVYLGADREAVDLSSEQDGLSLSRHLVTPTKTSQLTNDGAPNGGGTPYATTAQVAAKQDALSAAQLANIAAVPNKANATDLPYALVTPGEWAFGELPSGVTTVDEPFYDGEINFSWGLSVNGDAPIWCIGPEDALSLEWEYGSGLISATRASLPGHLLDRAGNRVVVTGDTTLTLPAAVAGYLRDFLVRLEISGSTVPTITFAASGNESLTYETDGDEFPVPDEAGDWLYSFTESCVAHKFAVSLKQLQPVAAPTQGGS